ncbi:MAG: sugar transferase [Candidatus Binatia bacterium]
MKRTFDIVVSFIGLVALFPLLVLAAVAIKLGSPGPVIFKQRRVGRGFRPFLIYKFRTMINDAPSRGLSITVGQDPRITQVGKLLRVTKIDELPQLVNVLKGDMTFVGPRPEVPRYVDLFRQQYEEILKVRPGITDLASLKYSDEARLLESFDNPEQEYITHVLPEKILLAQEYIKRSSLLFDLEVLFQTLLKLFEYRVSRERTLP